MAGMGAEIDQMDLSKGWIAARRLLRQFETGTQIGKSFQIAAAQIGRGLIAIVPGGDVGGVAREFRNLRGVDVEAGADDQEIMQPRFILTCDLHRNFSIRTHSFFDRRTKMDVEAGEARGAVDGFVRHR